MIQQKILPISCLCSIYINTDLNDFILSIDSLFTQEYIPDEYVIVVDGPIQKKINFFLDYLKEKENIFKIYYLKKNSGIGISLSKGLKLCKNEFVARFDTDDLNLKNRLKNQYDIFMKNSEVSIVGGNVIEFNRESKQKYSFLKSSPTKKENILKESMYRNPVNHPTVMFKKKDIITIGSYKNMLYFEDYELWLRSLKNNLIIYNLDKPLVAMDRKHFLYKRRGLKYAYYEMIFIIEVFKKKLIKKKFIIFFILRILIRIIPKFLSKIIVNIDPIREKKDYKFNYFFYTSEIKKSPLSLYKKFKSFELIKRK